MLLHVPDLLASFPKGPRGMTEKSDPSHLEAVTSKPSYRECAPCLTGHIPQNVPHEGTGHSFLFCPHDGETWWLGRAWGAGGCTARMEVMRGNRSPEPGGM